MAEAVDDSKGGIIGERRGFRHGPPGLQGVPYVVVHVPPVGEDQTPHLQPWIATWDMQEIYIGVEGKGANDASYATAIEIEYCRVHGIDDSGGRRLAGGVRDVTPRRPCGWTAAVVVAAAAAAGRG